MAECGDRSPIGTTCARQVGHPDDGKLQVHWDGDNCWTKPGPGHSWDGLIRCPPGKVYVPGRGLVTLHIEGRSPSRWSVPDA